MGNVTFLPQAVLPAESRKQPGATPASSVGLARGMVCEQRKADWCLKGEQPQQGISKPLNYGVEHTQEKMRRRSVCRAWAHEGAGMITALYHNSTATHFTNVLMQWRVAKYAQRQYQWGDKNKSKLAASPREIVLLCVLSGNYLDAWKAITGLGIIN